MIENLEVNIKVIGAYVDVDCGVIIEMNGKPQRTSPERLSGNLDLSVDKLEEFVKEFNVLIEKYKREK